MAGGTGANATTGTINVDILLVQVMADRPVGLRLECLAFGAVFRMRENSNFAIA